MFFKYLLVFIIVFKYKECAKILGVFPVTAKSHYILGSSLMKGLAEKGHDVTVLSPFGENVVPKTNGSYRDLVLTGFTEKHDKRMKDMNLFSSTKIPTIFILPFISKMLVEMTEETLAHSVTQELIHSDETFDVVIVEEIISHALKAFGNHFNGHLITLSTLGANPWVNLFVSNPTPLAYVPDPLLGYNSNMSFFQKISNTFGYVVWHTVNYIYSYGKHQELIDKYFIKKPKVEDVVYNSSLVLLNSHNSINQAVPYVPQMVDIGGYHVTPPKKLPKELQDYLDNAKNGVILFSLGSSFKSYLLPEETRNILINTFSKLREDVLWKWELDELPGKPDNVRIEKWLPQQDILAHPNVKLFITHAGLLSTIEIIYHGMPVLALPIGADQNLNAQVMVNQGVGLTIDIHDITEMNLSEAIENLLRDPKFRENAKTRSKLFHDRLMTPMDTAVYWIEYVIRNGGTKHLRVAGIDLPWYQYFLLDVIGCIVLGLIMSFYISKKIFCKILRLICKRNTNKYKQH